MSHYDARLRGSIDGVPFYMTSWQTTPGRRTHVHTYYGGEEAWVEDVGRAPYRLTGDIFVIGPNYHLERDKLRKVLEGPGPYRLVDPYRGPVTVRQTATPTFVEEIAREGMLRVGSISFAQTAPDEPTIYVTGVGKVADLVGLAFDALSANTSFSIKGINISKPTDIVVANNNVLASIQAAINSATSALRKVNGRIDGALGKISQTSAALDRLDDAVGTLLNTPNALMSTLTGLVRSTIGVLKTFEALVPTTDLEVPGFPVVEVAAGAIRETVEFLVEPVDIAYVPAGPQRELEAAALSEITLQTNAAGVLAGSDAAATLSYPSSNSAVSMAQQLASGFDAVLGSPTLHPETYEAMAAVRSAVTKYLLEQAAQLPQLEEVVLQAPQPALVLAWHLYGDPTRASEIGDRNGVDHHGFLPAGVTLEVLSA